MPKGTPKVKMIKMVWSRGEALPNTLTREQFATGLGVPAQDVNDLAEKLAIQPLFMRKPGQTKGFPSLQVFTADQMTSMLSEFEKQNVPPPPTMEQLIANSVQALQQTTLNVSNLLSTLTKDLAEHNQNLTNMLTTLDKKIEQVLMQERPIDTPAALLDNANEQPSEARAIRRRHS
jgi:hypothetical protein